MIVVFTEPARSLPDESSPDQYEVVIVWASNLPSPEYKLIELSAPSAFFTATLKIKKRIKVN